MIMDRELWSVLTGVVAVLLLASVIVSVKARRAGAPTAGLTNLRERVNSWWIMAAVLGIAALLGHTGTIILFAIISFLAYREFITLTPTRRGYHRALFWAFFVVIPMQYWLIHTIWYGLFIIFIPVYAFTLVPFRIVLAGDTERFLERSAKIQWGLLTCVYFISHIPALLLLEIDGYENQNVKLLLFLVLVTQFSDVFQYVWGKALGKHKIAPTVSPNKTIEGFIGGIVTASFIGGGLYWLTPFDFQQAVGLSLIVALMGFGGDLTMSAVKRDMGVKDFGALIPGHGGVMDRMDSLTFAAPVFFHLTRYFFTG
ncbi:MAG: phosphatidate cytidylyltransferase [Phycisphaerae bacterium]